MLRIVIERFLAMNIIEKIEKEQLDKLSSGKQIPDFNPGDTIKVDVKVV